MIQYMTQDMKKETILHTAKGTYVRRLINICSSAHEHMFIGSRTYVHKQAKQIVRPGRTMSPLGAHSSSLRGALTQGRYLCADEITAHSSRHYGSYFFTFSASRRIGGGAPTGPELSLDIFIEIFIERITRVQRRVDIDRTARAAIGACIIKPGI